MIKIVRSNSENKDFIFLVKQLDAYLKTTDGDEHEFYNQFNSINTLKHVVIAYLDGQPSGCGAFKHFNDNSVEVKRMFTTTEARGKAIATQILTELECWANELNYSSCVLETGVRQKEAIQFYKKNDYQIITNYGQYKGVENSLCFEKKIKR
ncbi:GNAT family N-acetyltransferase [uncultured Winogradskyella sp.]|uniref:GNAT family N-acetyltransferase n=1 Tax=uncultured Winogradskyella sp. TaxID=395353 RepID=UPI002624BBC9|nr:GNAT family N-acetyltransferase [uncultured Winogradskyella sp.]|tara:strand:- start:1799 stop:2254 length:456 start_codon:yes stop_codon:yes gene_type:complete